MEKKKTYKVLAGEILFHEGSKGQDIYFLKEGKLGIFKGEHEVAMVYREGSFVGEMAALLNKPRTATVRAYTDSILIKLPLSLEKTARQFPKILRKLFLTLRLRLQVTENKINLYNEMIYQDCKRLLLDLSCEFQGGERRLGGVRGGMEREKIRRLIDERIRESFAEGDFEFLMFLSQKMQVFVLYRNEREEHYGMFDPIGSHRGMVSQWKKEFQNINLIFCKKIAVDLEQLTECLHRFESASKTRQSMNRFQMERVIPAREREKILKAILEFPEDSREQEFINQWLEKTFQSAGEKDIPLFFPLIEKYGKEVEYQLKLEIFLEDSMITTTVTELR